MGFSSDNSMFSGMEYGYDEFTIPTFTDYTPTADMLYPDRERNMGGDARRKTTGCVMNRHNEMYSDLDRHGPRDGFKSENYVNHPHNRRLVGGPTNTPRPQFQKLIRGNSYKKFRPSKYTTDEGYTHVQYASPRKSQTRGQSEDRTYLTEEDFKNYDECSEGFQSGGKWYAGGRQELYDSYGQMASTRDPMLKKSDTDHPWRDERWNQLVPNFKTKLTKGGNCFNCDHSDSPFYEMKEGMCNQVNPYGGQSAIILFLFVIVLIIAIINMNMVNILKNIVIRRGSID